MGVFYHHFAPSLSSKVSLECVFKLMNVAVTLTQKKKLVVLVYFDRLFEDKVIHSKYYKPLKKGADQSHLGRQKWGVSWQISGYIK